MKSKTLEIIGGIGLEPTIVCYRTIFATYRQQKQGGNYPSILVNSIDLTKVLRLTAASVQRLKQQASRRAERQ